MSKHEFMQFCLIVMKSEQSNSIVYQDWFPTAKEARDYFNANFGSGNASISEFTWHGVADVFTDGKWRGDIRAGRKKDE